MLNQRVLRSASFSPPSWTIAGAAAMDTSLAALYSALALSIVVGGSTAEQGWEPATVYPGIWTRDEAYILWHNPGLQSATLRRQFITHRLSTASSNRVCDWIGPTGTITYNTAGGNAIWDGIAMVVLALWTDWWMTGDTSTFTTNQAAIDNALAAVPRDSNGCVYSDPATPIVDYGFTDTVLKTGDVAYGTALQAWAYKMLDQISGSGDSTNPAGTSYASLLATAQSGLATLYNSSTKFLRGSSVNNSGVDDVWASALAVAEGLIAEPTRRDIANNLATIYAAGSNDGTGAWVSDISQYGLVRHLPVGQYWSGTSTTDDTYQNGGYWATPLWDCVRAVNLVNPTLARQWALDFITQVSAEHTAEGSWTAVPYEWQNHGVGVGARGYSASAAVVRRFI